MIALLTLLAAYLLLCGGFALFGTLWPSGGVVRRAQVVIVLGGGAGPDGLLPVGQARVAAGVAALGDDQRLHMTGGLASGGSEAALMTAEAIRLGVAPDRITQEGASRTTQQNALFSQRVVGNDRVVIVSDNFHLARATILFRAYGYRVVGCRGTTYRRPLGRSMWFYAREGLSALLNLSRLIAWGLAAMLRIPRDWRIRNLT